MKLKRSPLLLTVLLPGVALSADFIGIEAPIPDQYIVVPELASISSKSLEDLAVDLAVEHGVDIKAVLSKGTKGVVVRATAEQLQSLMADRHVRLVQQDGYARSGDQETLVTRMFRASHPELDKQNLGEYFQQNGISIAASQDVTVQSADCAVSYRIADVWNGGFKADVTVTNKRNTAIDGWNTRWDFTGGEKIARAWRSILVAAGPAAEIGPETYNRSLAPGESVTFGFTADNNPARPDHFRLNGLSCHGTTNPPPPPPTGSSYGRLVLDESFSNRSTGDFVPYTLSMASADFNGLEARSGGVKGFDGNGDNWPADNRVGKGVVRANYPANVASGEKTGFLFDKRLPDTEEATLEYRVRFEGAGSDNQFDWRAGGKLPGLGGSSMSNGIPVGCTKDPSRINNGFSARLMWHDNGKLVTYTYLPDRTTNCGTVTTFFTNAQSNRWYTLRQHIRLNTPGQRNGLLEMYADGKLVLRMTDVVFRKSGRSDIKINDILFHTYRGGTDGDARFESPENSFIQFDDFKAWVK